VIKINIISGKIDCGKTTKLFQLYVEKNLGDGFLLRKSYDNEIYVGQQLVRLSTGESKPFSFRKGATHLDNNLADTYKNYSFTKEGFYFAEKIVMELLENNVEPIFIDEIGPLELQGKGFYDIFLLILKSQKEVFVVIRDSCVAQVIEKFHFQNYKVINIEG